MLKFMDFCAGIGGGRLGLELNGLKCVAYSEIDKNPAETYKLFYNDDNNFGDLMKIDINKIPDFDVMIAGFPCQTFSIVGKREGFEDDRGLVIYGLLKILKEKNVKAFIMENVKGLVNHNKGRTLQTISELLDDAGYDFDYKVLNSIDYGVPQMRERIYLVGFRKDIHTLPFEWPVATEMKDIKDYLIDEDSKIINVENPTFQKYLNNKYNKDKFNINEILKQDYLVLDWRQSDLRLYEGKCPTLRTGRHGILYVKDRQLRKLSGYEALLLQGFPKELADKAKRTKILDSKLLGQAGNAMTVSVIKLLCEQLLKCLNMDENRTLEGDKQMNIDDLILRGSMTAKNGFKNEDDVADKFNNWKTDSDAQKWLRIMNYNLKDIEYVNAIVI
uniref:DNA (cytosine-5-)-methyltransferase n=1 Tax=Clostridioides difficile TaxID=1496 RepID=UPI0028ACE27D